MFTLRLSKSGEEKSKSRQTTRGHKPKFLEIIISPMKAVFAVAKVMD